VKAAVLSALGRPLELATGLTWEPPRRGQALVKLAYSGVCHSQLMEARGKRGEDRYLPHLLGQEGTGKVLEVGEGVTKVKPGDFVVLGWIKGRGLEAGSVRYRHGAREINAGGVTTFNEYALVSENRLVLLPDGVPLDVGVLFGCALPTGAGIITNDLRPPPGSSLAVFGLGGIGMSALMATQLYDCRIVVAVDVAADKLALARDFGATDVVDASITDPVAAVRGLTGGSGADFAVEASGRARVIEQAFESIRRGGTCVFASHPAAGERVSLDPFELICGKQIRGSWGGNSTPDDDIPRFAALYRAGKLPLEKLIPRRYTLERVNDALDDLEAGRVGRPVLEIDAAVGSSTA
jgi:S-(hydroxymethyl)glutathione dehydrogenase / alcohol dehydrogenase